MYIFIEHFYNKRKDNYQFVMQKNILTTIYKTLYTAYGSQSWWPGDSTFEIIVGAILTQNTNWNNVEKAIKNLKDNNCLTLEAINEQSKTELADLIKPAGYFNIKADRLQNLTKWLAQNARGDLDDFKSWSLSELREQLLGIKGIGPETADSILLYAFDQPTFVIDTYTYRILTRHGLIEPEADYHELQEYCISQLEPDIQLYNEFHALIVQVGKNHCKPKAKCQGCPLEHMPHQLEETF